MALAVARHMIARGANPKFAADALASAEAMIQRIQGLETLDMRLPPSERRQAVAQALVDAKAQELTDQNAFDLESRPIYNIVNDNRYEQHWYTWNI
jgi:hypothetical protein